MKEAVLREKKHTLQRFWDSPKGDFDGGVEKFRLIPSVPIEMSSERGPRCDCCLTSRWWAGA
jgi:hypothetical protein